MSKSLKYLRKAAPERPAESDRPWQLDEIRTGIKELDEGWGVPHKDVADCSVRGSQASTKGDSQVTITCSPRVIECHLRAYIARDKSERR